MGEGHYCLLPDFRVLQSQEQQQDGILNEHSSLPPQSWHCAGASVPSKTPKMLQLAKLGPISLTGYVAVIVSYRWLEVDENICNEPSCNVAATSPLVRTDYC